MYTKKKTRYINTEQKKTNIQSYQFKRNNINKENIHLQTIGIDDTICREVYKTFHTKKKVMSSAVTKRKQRQKEYRFEQYIDTNSPGLIGQGIVLI